MFSFVFLHSRLWGVRSHCLNRACHLYSGVSALLPAYHAFLGLLLVLSTHDAKDDRDTAIEGNALDSLCRCITHEHIMACCPFHHTPKTDQCVIVGMAHHRLSNSCQFI